jgi:hypothetical protein
MLAGLGAIRPELAQWFTGAEKRGKGSVPNDPIPDGREALTKLFSEALFRSDIAHRPMPELGYQIYAWNGRDDACRSTLEIIAGSYTNSRPFPNVVVFALRKPTAENAALVTPSVLKSSLLGIVGAWQPEWVVLEDQDYWDHIENKQTGNLPKIRSGWMTYLSAPYARRIIPPAEVKCEFVRGGGLLMSATEELFSADIAAHVAAADAVQAALRPLQ